MAIELEKYVIDCPKCDHEIEFGINDIEDLPRDIEREIDGACAEERRYTEREFDGMIDPDDHPIHARTIHDLSAAIERGDTGEARLLLERVADDLGLEHREAVQIGRFSRECGAS